LLNITLYIYLLVTISAHYEKKPWNIQLYFHDQAAQIKIFDVNKPRYISDFYDIAILQLQGEKDNMPPFFECVKENDISGEEFPIAICGYQLTNNRNKKTGEFDLSKGVKLRKPSYNDIRATEEALVKRCGDKFLGTYSKLNRPETECVISKMVSGASGGAVVSLNQDNQVVLQLIYQQGHPKQYHELSLQSKNLFPSRFLVETGIRVNFVLSQLPIQLKNDILQL